MIKENFIKLYESSFRENWSLPAFTNYLSGETYSYANVSRWIAKVHLLLNKLGIAEGDKITLIAKDSAEWCMTYLGIITYGAVIVPILPDFSISDIHNIIRHSDSRLVFSTGTHLEAIRTDEIPEIEAVIDLNNLKIVHRLSSSLQEIGEIDVQHLFEQRYPAGFTTEDIKYPKISNEKVMLINYTSGTTGFSKGVILTANNLAGNVIFGRDSRLLSRNDRVLCFLPMAHAYSCAFNFLTPIYRGAHVYILGVLPTPNVLIKAFAEVRPNLIISVPLILEKMYKNVILPSLNRQPLKSMMKLPGLRSVVYRKIRNKLVNAMGGIFREFIVGGAAMNDEVTIFLHKIKFPFTIGYGMTECAPLISYINHRKYVPLSCGKILKGIMEIRIDDSDINTEAGVGEIQVRGENVCKGYYKNREATSALFTSDGWLRTGDLASIDRKGNIFIKGRSKTMILSSSGQNIYPEELEAKLNLLPFIAESLVLQQPNKTLLALIYPDYVTLRSDKITDPNEIEKIMEEHIKELNTNLASYEQIAQVKLMDQEFEKTPKKSIKRYKYDVYSVR